MVSKRPKYQTFQEETSPSLNSLWFGYPSCYQTILYCTYVVVVVEVEVVVVLVVVVVVLVVVVEVL